MNEQVQAWLMVQLEKLSVATDKAAEFAAGELPLFVQEFLTWYLVWNITVISICILIIVGTIYGGVIIVEHMVTKTRDGEYRGLYIMLLINIVPVLVALESLKIALMVTFAPRVFLLTEFIKFFK